MLDGNLFDFVLEHFNKLFYPEEWLSIDLEFSKTELFALMLVHRHHELTMSQLAGQMDVPMSTATGVIERLVRNHRIERSRSQTDRRIVTLSLTEEGRQLVEELRSSILGVGRLVSEALTEEEQQLAMKLFFKVMGVLSEQKAENGKQEESSSLKNITIE